MNTLDTAISNAKKQMNKYNQYDYSNVIKKIQQAEKEQKFPKKKGKRKK